MNPGEWEHGYMSLAVPLDCAGCPRRFECKGSFTLLDNGHRSNIPVLLIITLFLLISQSVVLDVTTSIPHFEAKARFDLVLGLWP